MNESSRYLPHIVLALTVSIIPHMIRLPVWISLWCALMWGYALLASRTGIPLPNRRARIALFAAGFIGFMATYSSRIGPNAYLGLLAVMAGLKPFETGSHRDRMITLFLAYFIVIASLFQAESLAATIHMFISVFVTTAVLVHINDAGSRFRADIRLSCIIMCQALPLTVILFFLFPRLQGSIVGFSRAPASQTGFSERLSPGSVSRLVKSSDVAFRAEFKGRQPDTDSLYWRGIVFQVFDGKTWLLPDDLPHASRLPRGKKKVEYTVSLEPHNSRWIFALDRPASEPDRSRMRADFTIKARRPVRRKIYYEMSSVISPGKASDWGVDMALQLPDAGNPRARSLAESFAENADSNEEIVERAMSHFRSGGFTYTLKPPKLGRNPVDDFLFESKKGFCEHFASSFAFLMRAAGVPARIAGGYLGGEANPYGGYLMVRQSDAHVWVEVWSSANGWYRVDPTAAAAPGRITDGVSGALPEGEFSSAETGWFQELSLGWDAVSSGWEAWFSGYSYEEQKNLIERLGIDMEDWRGPLAVFTSVFAAGLFIFVLYAVFQLRPVRAGKDRIGRGYERFCKKLAKAGIDRQPGQGPADFACSAAGARPDLKSGVDEVTELYIRLRYKEEQGRVLEKRFLEKVRSFKA